MLALRLPEELEERLTHLSGATGRSKSKIVRDALLEYLESREDYLQVLVAVSRYEELLKNPSAAVPFEELLSELEA